jgi:hypothetical protein
VREAARGSIEREREPDDGEASTPMGLDASPSQRSAKQDSFVSKE